MNIELQQKLNRMIKVDYKHQGNTEVLKEKFESLQKESRAKTMEWIETKEKFKIKGSIELVKQKEALEEDLENIKIEMQEVVNQYDYEFNYEEFNRVRASYTPAKIHTLRLDKTNRWIVGKQIHPNINVRSPKQMQFAPVLFCDKVIKFDGVCTNGFAQNDGFDDIQALADWINDCKECPDTVIVWSKK